jgi:hypothetical protein
VTLTSVNPCLWITKNLPKKLKNSEWGMDKQQSDTGSNCASPSSLQHELWFGTLWKMFWCNTWGGLPYESMDCLLDHELQKFVWDWKNIAGNCELVMRTHLLSRTLLRDRLLACCCNKQKPVSSCKITEAMTCLSLSHFSLAQEWQRRQSVH